MARTVTINIDQAGMEHRKQAAGKNFCDAMGYLCAYGNFTTVNIFEDGPIDMMAVFERENCRFVIGAIWNQDQQKYSFHS